MNYILIIEKELGRAFKELQKPKSKNWNNKNAYSNISILCPNSHNHIFGKNK